MAGLLEATASPVVRQLEARRRSSRVSMNGLRQVRIVGAARRSGRSRADHRERTATEPDGARGGPVRHEFEPLERRLGYRFRDRGLLEHALTHKSRAHEDPSGGVVDNESLEFLGDAVLGLVIADVLFREFPQLHEGQKSKMKATLVSTTSLAVMAEHLGLGEHLMLGRGEEKTGGRRKQALLADTLRGADRRDLPRRRPRGGARASSARARGRRSTRVRRRTSCATTSRRCRNGCRRTAGRCPTT